MKTSTFAIEISAPIQKVWRAISTTEGMKAWEGQKQIMKMLKKKLEEK